MTTTLPALTPLQETLFLTLAGRALDERSPRPILGDTAADEIAGSSTTTREVSLQLESNHQDRAPGQEA